MQFIPNKKILENPGTGHSHQGDNLLLFSIGRVLVNGSKERDGTGRVSKIYGNGFEKYERNGKTNGNG